MTQAGILRRAVDLLCAESYRADQRLLLADALDELAREQLLDLRLIERVEDTRAMAKQLRQAVADQSPEGSHHAR